MRVLLTALLIFVIMGVFGCKNRYDNIDTPPIVQAAQRGDTGAVKRILADDPSALFDTDSRNCSATECAILNGHHEIAIYLIESGYPVNPQNKSDLPLIMSCISRYTEGSRTMLKYLLDNGADANAIYEPEGWVALNMAANNGQEENIRLLVEYGARLDSRDRNGLTSIEMAERRLAQFKDPQSNYPHGELSDAKVRQDNIDKWERIVKLLSHLSTNPLSAKTGE